MKLFKLFSILLLGAIICVSCSKSDDDPNPDSGLMGDGEFVATGQVRDITPLSAVIEGQINTTFAGAYIEIGVQLSTSESFLGNNTIQYPTAGVSGKSFIVELLDYYGEGVLEPNTTYYYRAYANLAGTNYFGKVKKFTSSGLTPATSGTVRLGKNDWSAVNLKATSPEAAGETFFNNALDVDFDLTSTEIDAWEYSGNPKYDLTTKTLGSNWRTPTDDDWDDLLNNTRYTNATYKGVKGVMMFDKKTGEKCIFLPIVNYNCNVSGVCERTSKAFDVYATASSAFLDFANDYISYHNKLQDARNNGNAKNIERYSHYLVDLSNSSEFPEFYLVENAEPRVGWLHMLKLWMNCMIGDVNTQWRASCSFLVRPIKK